MLYNLSSLNSIAECDEVIEKVLNEKNQSNFEKSDVEGDIVSESTVATLLPERIARIDQEMAAKQALLEATTNVNDQGSIQIALNLLSNRRIRYIRRANNLAGMPIVLRQMEIGKLEHEIEAYDELLAALEARKVEISG